VYYHINSGLSYIDYIKAKKNIKDIGNNEYQIILEIAKKTFDLIAAPEKLALYKIDLLSSDQGLVKIAYKIRDYNEENPQITASFHWGFAHRLINIGRMADNLSLLIQTAETPEQTLSYNHFENARDAFRRKHYTDSLEEIDKAVFGSQTSAGYKHEWRFYLLQGIIHLGFFGCETSLFDLAQAADSLSNASNLALEEYPLDAASINLALGWVEYCQNRLDKALKHTSKAIELNPALGEAFFQKAKILFSQNNIKEAFTYLTQAVDRDSFYVLKAAADDSFTTHISELNDYFIKLKKDKYDKFNSRITDDLKLFRSSSMPDELQNVINDFIKEKSLLEIGLSEKRWNDFKLKPWFISKELEEVKLDHEAVISVVEPYREKVVIKSKTWYRSEKFKLITKNRVVEKRKKFKYFLRVYRDSFMFFTGKVLADYDMVLVEGGKFKMGDTNGIGRSDERPVQEVELNSFLISNILVTQKLWNLAMEFNPSNFEGYNLPVEHVSWYDCIEFCNRLSVLAGFTPSYTIFKDKTDHNNKNKNDRVKWTVVCDWNADGYRLATEAEWEYAAKGGKNCNFYNYAGSENVNNVAWHKDNSGYKTHEVAEKDANELGLYDMSGNVWEWCWDWYELYKNEPLNNPKGSESGSYRVLRGGSWADSVNYQRSSSRGKESPLGKYTSIGFRIVRNYRADS